MDLARIVLQQTLIMAIYMLAGYLLFKYEKISIPGSKSLASLLLYLVIPTVIIHSFCVPYSAEMLYRLGISAALAALALAVAVIVSRLCFKKAPVDHFAAAFSNAGFIGIPLVRASFGEDAVFYVAAFVVLLNLMQWTYGVSILCPGEHRLSLRSLIVNPILIGTAIALFLFFTGLGTKLPTVVSGTLSGISAVNSPIAMIVLGVYLAQTRIRTMLTTPKLYLLSAVRLLLIPLLTLALLFLIPAPATVRLVVLMAAAAPVGANVAVYAQLYDADYPYACQTVALTTILSILTLPVVIAIGSMLIPI